MEKIVYYSKGMEFFGKRIEQVYGYKRYNKDTDAVKTVFFQSLYFDEDFETLAHHKGICKVFWNGSDVLRMLNVPKWRQIIIDTPAIHMCHNKQLKDELWTIGIDAEVKPLFFGDVSSYQPSFVPSDIKHVYAVSHYGRNAEYGIDQICRIADKVENVMFEIYGVEGEDTGNVHYHGQVSELVMDNEIRNFHGCLRLNKHDGFSQTVMKSILMAQYPICAKEIDGVWYAQTDEEIIKCLELLKRQTEPNLALRQRYLDVFTEAVRF